MKRNLTSEEMDSLREFMVEAEEVNALAEKNNYQFTYSMDFTFHPTGLGTGIYFCLSENNIKIDGCNFYDVIMWDVFKNPMEKANEAIMMVKAFIFENNKEKKIAKYQAQIEDIERKIKELQ